MLNCLIMFRRMLNCLIMFKENAKLFDETPSGLRDHKMSMCEWDVEVENGFPGKKLLQNIF